MNDRLKESMLRAWYEYRNMEYAEGRVNPLPPDNFERGFTAGATEALASQWISVEDKLPPSTLVILCQCKKAEDSTVALCVYIKDRFMIYDHTLKYTKEFHPTHWMHIPSLKGGDK